MRLSIAITLLAATLSISPLGAQDVTWLASFNAGDWSGDYYVYNWLSFNPQMAGTSLTAATAQFFSCTNGSCAGPAYYVICLVNPGSGACPPGSAATSDATYGYSVSPNLSLQQFTFSGSNQITLTPGQTYYAEPYICCDSSQALAGGIQAFLGLAAPTTLSNLSYDGFGYSVLCGGEGLVCFGGAPSIFAQCNNGANLAGLYFGEYNIDSSGWYSGPVGSLLNGWYTVPNPSQMLSTFGGYGPNAAYYVGFSSSSSFGSYDACSGTGLNLTDAGTITVGTDLTTATFTITGPESFSGSGTSATFLATTGSYTITFGAVAGYITPPPQTEALTPGGTITFNGTYNPSRVTLNSITGWTAGTLVINAQWTGQPSTDMKPGTNIYDLFYAIDACQNATPCSALGTDGLQQVECATSGNARLCPVWHLNGSGFCPATGCAGQKGSIAFSDPSIAAVPPSGITSWTPTEVTFTPSFVPNVSFQYTSNPAVSVIMTTPDGLVATLPLPSPGGIVATIDARGYGQCTWYVANQRLAARLPIPFGAYYSLGPIDATYVPQQWDVLDFSKSHTAIIISPVTATPVLNPDGSTTTTYSFTIGEMNVGTCPTQGGPCTVDPWSEQPSTTPSKFVVTLSSTGVQSIQTLIYSLDTAKECTGPGGSHRCPATDYFR